MKPSLLTQPSKPLWGIVLGAVVVIVVALVAGCGGTTTVTKTVTVTSTPKTGFGAPSELAEFGYIKSLNRKGTGYEMRFDPAWYLSGVTANTAAAEDGAVPPGQPVPNDNYRLDEGPRLLTYLVPEDAHVTVLTRHGEGSLGETPIPVSELASIVNGGQHRPLFEPLKSGVWIRYHIDTVSSIDQQYQP
jgi:hypothetical protein